MIPAFIEKVVAFGLKAPSSVVKYIPVTTAVKAIQSNPTRPKMPSSYFCENARNMAQAPAIRMKATFHQYTRTFLQVTAP